MSEWRDRCEHGRYEGHRFEAPDFEWVKWESCPGGRPVTDAEIREMGYQVWLKDQARLIAAGLDADVEQSRTSATGGNADAPAI